MSFAMLLSMGAFALAASISPGPVNLVCLSSGTRYPVAQGLIFVTGATLGFVLLFLAIGLGLYSAMQLVAGLDNLLRWLGAVFLLYLSLQLMRDNGRLSDDRKLSAPGFFTGALMQWLNPKAWLASASGIAAYTNGQDIWQVAVFAGLYLPICWLSLSCWVYAGAYLQRHVHRPLTMIIINRTLALLLALSTLYLLFG
ncbi:LysE family translocator [Bowmanella yangjiangensis]|uniref:LysE family translocator n=1 Tax=Bowmanella yangjiangensis TaxID=2811230 RepID=A0ABS3CYC9_9ALTE|nr:LysE family translocator [Bowmanella yangjiangensis]MBN7822132.1 LysE family translocator [Bowmanella yangjiangensis]